MNAGQLAVDGLWQCLCPAFRPATLARSYRQVGAATRPRAQCLVASRTRRGAASQARIEAAQFHHGQSYKLFESNDPRRLPGRPKGVTTPRMRAVQGRRERPHLDQEHTPFLYELLRTAASKGETKEVDRIVEILVQDRLEEPNLRLYGSLILVNVHPFHGSVGRVNALLEEMAEEGLVMDVGLCHDVLKVLSVHLDYLLRSDILLFMRERWLNLSWAGHHDVAAGLLREGQFELATEKLTQMRGDGIKIETWLKDMAVLMLIEAGELDEALQLLKDRIADGELNISKTIWYSLLDHGSAAFHHNVVTFTWNSQVAIGHLNPSSGICFNVLTTAARVGDARLATDVFRVLGQRSTVFSAGHYEQLLSTYLFTSPPDLRAALSVLTIMASTKLEPSVVSTRPIYEYLQQHSEETGRAFDLLTELHASGRRVPIAALNVLIESYVNRRNFKEALVLYKSMHTFEEKQEPGKPRKIYPNIETFNLLFRGARRVSPAAYGTAMFLASELLALGIRPNTLTYDRLVSVSLKAGELDSAYRYFDEMESLGWTLRPGPAASLARALAAASDERCWDVLQRTQDRGAELGKAKRDVEFEWSKHQLAGDEQVGLDGMGDGTAAALERVSVASAY